MPVCAALIDLLSDQFSNTKWSCCFWRFKGSHFLGTIITRAAHGLKLLNMQPAFSNNLISSLMDCWYFSRIGYDLHAKGDPEVRMSTWKRFVLPTSLGYFEIKLLLSPSSNENSLSLASCDIWGSHKTIECLVLLCSGWRPDSDGKLGHSTGLSVVSAVPFLVHVILLTQYLLFLLVLSFLWKFFLGYGLCHVLY